jgi:hypothetical protein
MIATKISFALITSFADVNQIMDILLKQANVNTIRAIPTVIVISMIAKVCAMALVGVNVSLIMFWIRKQKFVIKLLRYRVIVSLIVVKINSVLMICVNVDQAIIKLKIHVTANPVILTAIVIFLIRIVFVLRINANVDLDTLWIQRLNYVRLETKSHAIRSMIAVLINSVLKIYANANRTMNSMIHLYVNSNLVVMTVTAINSIAIGFVIPLMESVRAVKLTTK